MAPRTIKMVHSLSKAGDLRSQECIQTFSVAASLGDSLYTLHPTPYTLHPTPSTLHPTPYTLYPTPYTLHPEPEIRNLKPSAIISEPYTIKPEPQTLGSWQVETLNPKPVVWHGTSDICVCGFVRMRIGGWAAGYRESGVAGCKYCSSQYIHNFPIHCALHALLKFKTPNPKSEARNSKPPTRKSQLETRNPKFIEAPNPANPTPTPESFIPLVRGRASVHQPAAQAPNCKSLTKI